MARIFQKQDQTYVESESSIKEKLILDHQRYSVHFQDERMS